MTVRMIFQKAKCKSVNSMRYEAEWLLECLLLNIKSSKTYNHLRAVNLVPLPHPVTLRRLLSGVSAEFGFSDFALKMIEQNLSGKDLSQRLGVITLDELKTTEEITYNAQNHRYDGLVHLELEPIFCFDENNDSESSNVFDNEQVADHGLVFVYRSLLDNWVQPIGVFASKGGASGDKLFKLLVTACIRLEEHGGRVIAVVNDGAQTNKAMWKLAGINISADNSVRSSMPHPTVPEHDIYFLLDPPHAWKCIRNQIYNHGITQVT